MKIIEMKEQRVRAHQEFTGVPIVGGSKHSVYVEYKELESLLTNVCERVLRKLLEDGGVEILNSDFYKSVKKSIIEDIYDSVVESLKSTNYVFSDKVTLIFVSSSRNQSIVELDKLSISKMNSNQELYEQITKLTGYYLREKIKDEKLSIFTIDESKYYGIEKRYMTEILENVGVVL